MTEISALIFKEATENPGIEIAARGIEKHNKETTGLQRESHYIWAQDGDETIKGGLNGYRMGGVFIVKWLWVHDDLRGTGLGRELMNKAAAKAAALDCKRMAVDTMSYQAPEFYEKCGYTEKARVTDYYEGYDRIFFERII